jgi:acyl carrier protein
VTDSIDSLRTRVIGKAAELAGIPATDFDPASTLESVGLDSSDAVILAMEVEETTGVEIDVGIFLRFETIGEAADEIQRIIGEKRAA